VVGLISSGQGEPSRYFPLARRLHLASHGANSTLTSIQVLCQRCVRVLVPFVLVGFLGGLCTV